MLKRQLHWVSSSGLRRCFQLSLNILCAAIIVLCSVTAHADRVTPGDRVTRYLNVRESPVAGSGIVGRLLPGEQAEIVGSIPNWYKIRIADGTEGFVSKSWVTVVADPANEIAFEVHFVDVGTGDAAIIDIGDKEIVIDGGDSTKILHDYAARTGIIDGPIELVVVTHSDSDHWKGLTRLLGFDGQATAPHSVLEFWEPGYDRRCSPLPAYDKFISDVKHVPGIRFHRPLEAVYKPAVKTGDATPITLASIPGVKITVLHTASAPENTNGDCAYTVNDASIVLMIDIGGVRFLFTGDENGKERDEPAPGTPGHVEKQLLELERAHPGVLKADVLKVPHHGSETASTQAFINAVDPKYVIISADTRHQLPKSTTVNRYENGRRIVLRTDQNRASNTDHIICFRDTSGVSCNYEDVIAQ